MCSTHNEGKSVVAVRCIRILKGKIYRNLTANNSKSYLSCLNKLVDEYNNTYHHSIDEEPIDANYSALSEGIETNPKAPKLKLVIESGLLSTRIFLAKATQKMVERNICYWFSIENQSMDIQNQRFKRRKIIGSFMKKNCYWVNYKWVIVQ